MTNVTVAVLRTRTNIMPMQPKIGTRISWPARFLCYVVVAVAVVMYWASHFISPVEMVRSEQQKSDGYHFLVQAIRQSQLIRDQVGEVRDVRWSGGKYQDHFGSKRWTATTLSVSGSKGSATVTARAEKTGGAWRISAASVDGQEVPGLQSEGTLD